MIFSSLRKSSSAQSRSDLYLHNTLGNENQIFKLPPIARYVRMYNCGPTVYGEQHIGNLSMFVFTDVLRRVLQYHGHEVKQVINITDFGHLSGDNQGDADIGEDRMTKGLKRENMAITMENMALLAEKYTQVFLGDLTTLNIDVSKIEFPRASAYVPAQIAMIQTLIEKGYAYQCADGVYYDTLRFPDYGILGGIDLEGLKAGARVAMSSEKRHPTDFLLWKSDASIGWESPWGKGFPGWHIECSAMARAVLGEQIDIHTGGIEHIPIHHNNEIAQSEAATGKKPFSRFWMHRAHLQIDGGKIAKSDGNVVYLSEIIERGFHPIAFRYLCLGAHYRTNANFSWDALAASQSALVKLTAFYLEHADLNAVDAPVKWQNEFDHRVNDDLDTPGALATVWAMLKSDDYSTPEKLAALRTVDMVLGLTITEPDEQLRTLAQAEIRTEIPMSELPENIRALVQEREEARTNKNWSKSDELRATLTSLGYSLDDAKSGVKVYRI
ncbi:MAG: Cysteinyl-tRNA synthetase [Candidatus Kaiserbacteria bacterium]|nr:Cysteinyl-tRNA synthetase [Candidatus Kaiserbacteria bacterium]